MENRLKYRVWDKKECKMLYHGDIFRNDTEIEIALDMDGNVLILSHEHYYPSISKSDEFGEFVVMQDIGLKDKNGKCIFEGDVVFFSLDVSDVTNHDGKSAIVWEEGCFYARGNNHCNLAGGYFAYCEVLGNIHEHTDLLA
jgi:uncharacterized phage protein (TIGR01671 family)